MKALKTMVVGLLLAATATPAMADVKFINPDAPKFYSRLFFGYNPMFVPNDLYIYGNGAEVDGGTFQGFNLGWEGGIKLTPKIPIYLEFGLNTFADFYTATNLRFDEHFSLVGFNLPIHAAYRIEFGDGDFALTPYTGPNFRLHVYGHNSVDGDGYDVFSDDDLGGQAWNRFQVGWSIGVNGNFKKLHFGLGYTADFNKLTKYSSSGMFNMSVGLFF